MEEPGKLRQILAFCAGAAAATLVADALLIAFSGGAHVTAGLVHHVEFLGTLIAIVGMAGALGLGTPPRPSFSTRALVALGAIAVAAGFAIGVTLAPAVGQTASIVGIVVTAAAVPRIAARFHRIDRTR